MVFGVVDEKELPEFSNTDANKVLKVDASGVYLQWLQETVAPAELPSQAGKAGHLLTTNGSVASWTNGPIGLGTTGAATPMLWFGASNNGFAEAWTAGGGATGVSAITNGAVCCTFQSGAIRLPGGNPIRSNGNAAARFQFTSDVPNMQNSVTTGTVGTDRIVNVSSANWTSTSLDLVCSNTNDTPGALNASSMGIEIKQNQIVFNGAGTTASGTTLPARVTRMSISNVEVATSLPLSVSNYITASSIIIATTGFVMNQPGTTTAQAYTFRNFDTSDSNRNNTNRQGIYSPAVGAIAISTNSISVGTTAGSTAGRPDAVERFRVDDNYVTVTNSLNLSRTNPAPSATAPHLFFGDITAPVSGIWGTNDNLFFGTNGTQRMNINNNGIYINGANNTQQGIIDITDSSSSAGAPSIKINATVGNDTGIFSNMDGRIQISSQGSEVFRCEQSTNYNYNVLHVNDHLRMVNNKEIQFGTTTFGTNAIKGTYAGDNSEILFTIGDIQHVQFKKSQVNFLRNVSFGQCPLYDFTLFSNNSSEYQIGTNTPPVIFFSPPAANNSTNTVFFPTCDTLPAGWQVRIIFHNMNDTWINNKGRLRFATQTVNLFRTGVSYWNANDYNELVNGTVVDVINYRRTVTADSRWYVVGVVSP